MLCARLWTLRRRSCSVPVLLVVPAVCLLYHVLVGGWNPAEPPQPGGHHAGPGPGPGVERLLEDLQRDGVGPLMDTLLHLETERQRQDNLETERQVRPSSLSHNLKTERQDNLETERQVRPSSLFHHLETERQDNLETERQVRPSSLSHHLETERQDNLETERQRRMRSHKDGLLRFLTRCLEKDEVSTGVYWCLLVSTGVYWCLLVSTGVYWGLLVSTGVYWCLLGSTGVYWGLLVSTGVYWGLLVSTGVYWCLLGSTGLVRDRDRALVVLGQNTVSDTEVQLYLRVLEQTGYAVSLARYADRTVLLRPQQGAAPWSVLVCLRTSEKSCLWSVPFVQLQPHQMVRLDIRPGGGGSRVRVNMIPGLLEAFSDAGDGRCRFSSSPRLTAVRLPMEPFACRSTNRRTGSPPEPEPTPL
ncbi:hypothetical protein N1851_031616 [Merluccius polli]|uniref:Uncharacterized protein n=1 Tax=Merluccius polli TaxID=89951 RepID=A0AA47NP22_MERPO|nr:hypothetical protein N1851_031616 [Merluccius polli]